MSAVPATPALPSGVPYLDAALGGGIPAYSLTVLAGRPGTGKTVLAQQLAFATAAADDEARVLYLVTLSEPPLKLLRYLQGFSFFDPDRFERQVRYLDLGDTVRERPLEEVAERIATAVEEFAPRVAIIDSFRAIADLSADPAAFRRFCFDLSSRLAATRCTTLLLGEYDLAEIGGGAEFAVADGIVYLDLAERDGELRRELRVLKLRGQPAASEPVPFALDSDGLRLLGRAWAAAPQRDDVPRDALYLGAPGLDSLVPDGIPAGSSIVVGGVSGTGKTTLGLQFLVRGAEAGQRGLLVAYEEGAAQLREVARGFGWDLADLERRGLLRIRHVPETEVRLVDELDAITAEIAAFEPRRIVVDSLSLLLHRAGDARGQRDAAFALATLARRSGAVALLVSDIVAGAAGHLSRFGVEETVTDGLILLSSDLTRGRRQRYLEVYKLRGRRHPNRRFRMEIGPDGLDALRISRDVSTAAPPPPIDFTPLRALVPDGIRHGAVWLVRGGNGVGKTAFAWRFLLDGLQRGERGVAVATEVSRELARAELAEGAPELDAAMAEGRLLLFDAHPASGALAVDPADPERFLSQLASFVDTVEGPSRVAIDSLTPFSAHLDPAELLVTAERAIRLLRHPQIALLATLHAEMLDAATAGRLASLFDVVVDLYLPDWGEMADDGRRQPVLAVRKAPAPSVDPRPYPYRVEPGVQLVVRTDFYDRA